MLFLYSDPTQEYAPAWYLHLETLTLAQLDYTTHYRLLLDGDTHIPDTAFKEIAADLEASHPGSSRQLAAVSRPGLLTQLPEILCLAPAAGPSGILAYHHPTRFALGLHGDDILGPIHAAPPFTEDAERRRIIATLAETIETRLPSLRLSLASEYLPALWLHRPDTQVSQAT